jgi:hypothetical protein
VRETGRESREFHEAAGSYGWRFQADADAFSRSCIDFDETVGETQHSVVALTVRLKCGADVW